MKRPQLKKLNRFVKARFVKFVVMQNTNSLTMSIKGVDACVI